jgi:hypothetical protein
VAQPSFVTRQFLGWTARGKPNTADGDSAQSVAIATEVLSILGVSGSAPGGQTAGTHLEDGVRDFLSSRLPAVDPSRNWRVDRRRLITHFRQYEHLARLERLVEEDETDTLRVEIGQDYLIAPDVTVGLDVGEDQPFLHAAVSCKFTIRSDRVQNIRHEGVILTRHRRGRQPHIVTVTAEPLPSRLAAICRGTGEVDAVYHVCLPELSQAVDTVGNNEQRSKLDEVTSQRRLFDLHDLVAHLTV